MKFFHLSDLHLGKVLHHYDLEKEQRVWMEQIVQMAREEKPDAIVIAGDIYDKSVPSASATNLLDEFLLALSELNTREHTMEVLIIAGNHDNAARLNYGSAFLKKHHIHIAACPPQTEEEFLQKVVFEDVYGEVVCYLLPFTKPGMLRKMEHAEKIESCEQAVSYLLEREQIDTGKRNILVSHQFYVNGGQEPKSCQSEMVRATVGGLDSVDIRVVSAFDYVALGHIHSPQVIGRQHIRYCGTPYKYSVSEAMQEKSVTVVSMGKKGECTYRQLPLKPKKDVIQREGTMEELVKEYSEKPCSHYASLTLTDEEYIDIPKDYLDNYYDSILEIKIKNSRTEAVFSESKALGKPLTPYEAFCDFFYEINQREMNEEEKRLFSDILEEAGKEMEEAK